MLTALEVLMRSLPFYLIFTVIHIKMEHDAADILQVKFGDDEHPKKTYYRLYRLMLAVVFFDLQRFLTFVCSWQYWGINEPWPIWLLASAMTPAFTGFFLEWLLLRPESTEHYREKSEWYAKHPCDP